MRWKLIVVMALLTAGHTPTARADSAPDDASVVLAPITTLMGERTRATKRVTKIVESAIRALPGIAVVPAKKVSRAIRAAKQPELNLCQGKAPCLIALARLLNAKLVVHAELGGIGSVQIAYLKLVSTRFGKEVRSTTIELVKGKEQANARAAAVQLLTPAQYTGRLQLNVDARGARIFLNGKQLATSPAPPLALPVGTHALWVSHPEFRDFVRFVNVGFGKNTTLDINLHKYPIKRVKRESPGTTAATAGSVTVRHQPPWYRRGRWIAAAAAVTFLSSAIVVGILSDGIDFERKKIVEQPTPP